MTVKRVLVATDNSKSATRAVDWAADMANRFGAELHLVQVVVPQTAPGTEAGSAEATRAQYAAQELAKTAERLAGPAGKARVLVDSDPARAIVRAAEEAAVDVVVVGNLGMSGRKEFLLGNVPNRISHQARCTVIIVNTAELGDGQVAKRAPADGDRVEVAGHLLGRAADIGKVMAKLGVREVFTRAKPGDEESTRTRARRFRAALEELGPTFAKLGQMLSTRPDLLPPEFVEELSTLQDQVPPMTEDQVVRVMEQELGVPWEDVFESIVARPMAAGTIAQVHRATMADGQRVVIKVQRPNARQDIMRDLGLLKMFAEKTAERQAFRSVVDMGAIFEHLSASLQRELDFRQEANNIEKMRQVLAPYTRLDVPKVFSEYSTDRLLVLEEIQGGPIRDAPLGEARKEAARQLLESYYRQILGDGFFHADPHPGNLMWWNDKIYFLDFGMVGEIGSDVRELLVLLLMSFWQEDVPFLSDVVLMIAGEDQRADIDLNQWQEELGSLLAKYRHMSLREIQLGPILQEITEISIRHEVALPASLALSGKALSQMQLATAELDPTLDPFAVAGRFLQRGLLEKVRARMDPKTLFYETQKIRVRVLRLVEAIERLAGARPGPKLQVMFRGMEPVEASIRRGSRRLSLALTAGGAMIGTAITAASGSVEPWIPATLGGVGGALTLSLVVDLLRRKG
ncbi:MAG TPA: AarF/UbiB family protein [Actinomycetota bacterium]|nr:AarF/UbiB family protein [Actinomycetota bacterium]